MMLQTPPEGQISAPSSQCILILLNGPDFTFPLSSLRIAPNLNKVRVRTSKLLENEASLVLLLLFAVRKALYICWLLCPPFLVILKHFCIKAGKMFRFPQILSPPLCSSDTNTVFMGMCMQLLPRHYSLPIQCKFLSQDLKVEMLFLATFPVQLLVVFSKAIYNYVSDLSPQVPHNTTALHFRLLNAYTLVDVSQTRQASMDIFCFL